MVKCFWCGLETSDHETCEWCKKVLPVQPPTRRTAPLPLLQSDDEIDPNSEEYINELDPVTRLPSMMVRMEWFLGLYLPLLAVMLFLVNLDRQLLTSVMFGGAFMAGLFLSSYQVVESVDDHWQLVGFASVFAILISPLAMGVLFTTLFFFYHRNDFETAGVLMIAYSICMLAICYAAVPELSVAVKLAGWPGGNPEYNLPVMALVTGWVVANFWRPLNE